MNTKQLKMWAWNWIDETGNVIGYNSTLASSRADAIALGNGRGGGVLKVYEPSLVEGNKAKTLRDNGDAATEGMFD